MDEVKSYTIGEISSEQFVSEHTFCYVIKGVMHLYDGSKTYIIRTGECCLVRKNHLLRFMKEKVDNELDKVFVFFDEAFLKGVEEKTSKRSEKSRFTETIIGVRSNNLVHNFVRSLAPYYVHGVISAPFEDVKREELLLILLQQQPELADILFDYGIPQKINLEEFMNRNYKFNVSMERFAFLSGRSLSAFKRDFKQIFDDAPGHWLVKRRLKEAHFLLKKRNKTASEIYLDLGFETLSHFSYAFKKQFGYPPSELGV